MKKKRKAAPPYWIIAAEVICESCDGRHARAVATYCVACDCILCPFCAARHRKEVFCPECAWQERSTRV